MKCHLCIYWTPENGCAHYGPEQVKQIQFPRDISTSPHNNEIVLGFDEDEKAWTPVRYRADSNRFFDHPYTGAVYPLARMYKYKPYEQDAG
jgi:hypothetical protein